MATKEADRPRIIVFGSRSFFDQQLLFTKMDALVKKAKIKDPIIVLGGQKTKAWRNKREVYIGADHLAEQWATARKYTMMIERAEWYAHGALDRSAGPKRNAKMVEIATQRRPAYAVGFWDGTSPGTKDMIDKCKKARIKLVVIRFEE